MATKAPFDTLTRPKAHDFQAAEALLVVLKPGAKSLKTFSQQLNQLPVKMGEAVTQFAKHSSFKPEPGACLTFDMHPTQRIVVCILPKKSDSRFAPLGVAAKSVAHLKSLEIKNWLLDIREVHDRADEVVDAWVSAWEVAHFEAKKQSKEVKKKKSSVHAKVMIVHNEDADTDKHIKSVARTAWLQALGTNHVRDLAMRPANDLDCKTFCEHAAQVAKERTLDFRCYTQKELKKMGAGAFIAVAQGSAHEDASILRLSYTPKKKGSSSASTPHVAVVGKGVVYDTGGVNLKPARGMYGMEGDMTGAAVALALVELAAREQWSFGVKAYLAIVDNAIGSRSYRPNEVITSLSGQTIETVHTDAEGRMALADTLYLAGEDKPEAIVDFATLTGACVGAVGESYMGVFCSDEELNDKALKAGRESGERCWPFPMDKDLGACLDSEVADVKQCRLTGGVDHIEAALFLKRFVPQDTPWVHVDLSSSTHEGGLAHIPTRVTGTGVRFGKQLIGHLFQRKTDL